MKEIDRNANLTDTIICECLWNFDFEVMDSYGEDEIRKKVFDECISEAYSEKIFNKVFSHVEEKHQNDFKSLYFDCIKLAFELRSPIGLYLVGEKKAIYIKLLSSFMIFGKPQLELLKRISDVSDEIEIVNSGEKNLNIELVVKAFFR